MNQYLILHKVRGEPSFDCAINIGENGEECWITNSGHRAYPYWHCKITDLGHFDFNLGYQGLSAPAEWYPMPKDWPDHFNIHKEASMPKMGLGELMAMVMPKIKRRI